MSKEKSPFEKTAAALKIMGKKISAKKGTSSNILKCVFVPNRTAHAIGTETIANVLYGAEAEGGHIATLTGLMLVAWPLRQNKHDIEVVPSKAAIQSYFAERSETDEKDEDNEQS